MHVGVGMTTCGKTAIINDDLIHDDPVKFLEAPQAGCVLDNVVDLI